MLNRGPSRIEWASTLMAPEEYPRNGQQNSDIFTSFPALGEAAAYLTQTTSYLARCFGSSIEDSVFDEGQELVTLPSGQSVISESESGFTDNGPGTTSLVSDEEGMDAVGSSTQATSQPLKSASVFRFGPSIFQGLISRARTTVLGSAEDIGWLQRAPDVLPVEDGTKRFMDLLENVRNDKHKLPDSLVYLLVPGLFSNHGPLYFVNTKTCFSKMGLTCHIAKIHSEASVEKNARELKEYIEEIYWGAKKRVLLLGHSKGGVDSAAALSLYWPDLKDKVAGLALAQSPYGGSPIASDILRDGQLGDYVQLRKVMEVLICKVLKGDLQALEDLTYAKRREFLSKHPLPRELPVVSFHTQAGLGPSVLATLSQVAHAELPVVGNGQSAKVPVVMPLSAAMAACAQLLQVRYGEKSDGLVTRRDAEVPGSVVVRPNRKLDHAWMVYSTLNDNPGEADASQVCEALLTLLIEVGRKRRHAISMKDEYTEGMLFVLGVPMEFATLCLFLNQAGVQEKVCGYLGGVEKLIDFQR